MISRDQLSDLLQRFPQRRVAVVGDFFLDKYLEVDPALAEPSLETGRTAHQVVEVRRSPGAAGTVVNNLAALGAGELHALGAVGDDGEAFDLCQGLSRLRCSTQGLLRCPELMTPTYLKPRDAGVEGLLGEHSRYDTKNRRPMPAEIVERLGEELTRLLRGLDAVVIMDQVELPECGVVTTRFRKLLSALANKFPQVLFWADSRRHIQQFRNIVIKPNQFEAVGRANPLPGDEVSLRDLQAAIPRLHQVTKAPVFVTCGDRGMLVSEPEVTHVPGLQVRGPIDPTGAGDSATAGALLALASGASPAQAALVGNLVASVTVRQLGTTGTATPARVLEALDEWHTQHPTL
jgi:bifunctional ADP-heptose synthase (sugar kinase/adenylyltransferase)